MSTDDGNRRVWIPIYPVDVEALENLLVEADPFVTEMIEIDSPYSLIEYVNHEHVGGVPITAILDRNLISRAVRLALGGVVDHSTAASHTDRAAAACMAFLITAKIEIEPNISLYELAETKSVNDANAQLTDFRVADHIHPQAYLDVALGRAERIENWVRDEAIDVVNRRVGGRDHVDLGSPLLHWKRHRTALTRLAILDRQETSGFKNLQKFIDWSLEPGFFDALAITFAVALFGRHRSRRMLRGIRSRDHERCEAAIRNTAWDLTYISYWEARAKSTEGSRLWMFITNDRVCRQIARAAVGDDRNVHLIFAEHWPPPEASALYEHYAKAVEEMQAMGTQRFRDFEAIQMSLDLELSRCFEGP
ncbi:MAG: hypothetical protein NXI30_02810 [bacterium]|nr:hypothetical protein [bacterium]